MPYCAKCGTMVAEGMVFCPGCGQAQGAAPPAAGSQSGLTENVAGLLCYALGWITGLIFFLIDKRPYVRFHAAQSMVVFGALHILRMVLGGIFGVGFFLGGWTGLSMGVLLVRSLLVKNFLTLEFSTLVLCRLRQPGPRRIAGRARFLP